MKPVFFLQNALKLTYSNVEFKKMPGVARGRGRAWVGDREVGREGRKGGSS